MVWGWHGLEILPTMPKTCQPSLGFTGAEFGMGSTELDLTGLARAELNNTACSLLFWVGLWLDKQFGINLVWAGLGQTELDFTRCNFI